MRLLVFSLMCLVSSIFAIDVTKIGIVDFEKVSMSFLSPQIRANIEQLRNQYQGQINLLNTEIQELKKQYDEAIGANDLNNARIIGNNYNLKVDELKRTSNLVKNNLENQKRISLNSLNNDNTIWGEILKAIQYVAESTGTSLVMKKDNPYILYYNSTVDITDDVMKHLSNKTN